MCRNHRGWVESYVAVSKLGAHALFLNTAFSGPQLTDVAKREEPEAVIFDEEFAELLEGADRRPQALHRLARARRRPRPTARSRTWSPAATPPTSTRRPSRARR